MAENYKHLYEQMKKMVGKYQDEIVPGLRKVIEQQERKWIPVTERLPDVRVPVLTYGRKGAVGIGFVQPTSVAEDGKVYFYARYGDSLPTHWMPLPETPREGE